jgi:single-strand DNA-binding protein
MTDRIADIMADAAERQCAAWDRQGVPPWQGLCDFGSIADQPAENAAESLSRGSRVIITGKLKQRSFETKEGEKRTVMEVDVDEIGPSLRFTTARVEKAGKSTPKPADDPWGAAPSAGEDEPPW